MVLIRCALSDPVTGGILVLDAVGGASCDEILQRDIAVVVFHEFLIFAIYESEEHGPGIAGAIAEKRYLVFGPEANALVGALYIFRDSSHCRTFHLISFLHYIIS